MPSITAIITILSVTINKISTWMVGPIFCLIANTASSNCLSPSQLPKTDSLVATRAISGEKQVVAVELVRTDDKNAVFPKGRRGDAIVAREEPDIMLGVSIPNFESLAQLLCDSRVKYIHLNEHTVEPLTFKRINPPE